VRAVGAMNRSFADSRKSGAGPPTVRPANAPAVDKWVNDGL
jgi:hypothetical protein